MESLGFPEQVKAEGKRRSRGVWGRLSTGGVTAPEEEDTSMTCVTFLVCDT